MTGDAAIPDHAFTGVTLARLRAEFDRAKSTVSYIPLRPLFSFHLATITFMPYVNASAQNGCWPARWTLP